jgi:hypothetical protein
MPLDKYQQTAADYLGWLWMRADLDYESNKEFYEEARDGLAIILRRTEENAAQHSVHPTCPKCGASLSSGTTPKDGKQHCPVCGASW